MLMRALLTVEYIYSISDNIEHRKATYEGATDLDACIAVDMRPEGIQSPDYLSDLISNGDATVVGISITPVQEN